MVFKRIIALLFLSVFCSISIAADNHISPDDILLQAGETKIRFFSGYNWSPGGAEYKGGEFLYEGGGNGTVVKSIDLGTSWMGTHYFNETLLSSSVVVDGVETSAQKGTTYSGNHLVMNRTTRLGTGTENYFTLSTQFEVTNGKTVEKVTLRREDSTIGVDVVYGFLSSRLNRLNKYAGFDENGTLLYQGDMDVETQDAYMPGCVSVAQYDSENGDGLISTVTIGTEYDLTMFIPDRVVNNKLYCKFYDLDDPGATRSVAAGTEFFLQQETVFFQAEKSNWISEAQVAMVVPEPASMTLLMAGAFFLRRKKRSRTL